ncbi:hypothetical protein BGZ83_000055 [Gryganskiella cystojenkinii]|nr:hypothetical protein BGZ83_000055 [Gryganskiella cystojenkinii]
MYPEHNSDSNGSPSTSLPRSLSLVPFFPPTASALHQKRRKAKKHALRVPRPKNCFMLYRTQIMPMIMIELGNINNKIISQIAAERWNAESEPVKVWFRMLAKKGKEEHAINHPGYKYAPHKKLIEDIAAGRATRGDADSQNFEQDGDEQTNEDPMFSGDGGDIDGLTYDRERRLLERQVRVSTANKSLARRQRHVTLLGLSTGSVTRRPSGRGYHQAKSSLSEDYCPRQSREIESSALTPIGGVLHAGTMLGPGAAAELEGSMYINSDTGINDFVNSSYQFGFGPTTTTSSTVFEHCHGNMNQFLIAPQRQYDMHNQNELLQQHRQFQSQSRHLHQPRDHQRYHYFDQQYSQLHPVHLDCYHAHDHPAGQHSFYAVDSDSNASAVTLVDHYYDPYQSTIFDPKMLMEKDLPPLPVEANEGSGNDSRLTFARVNTMVFRSHSATKGDTYADGVGQDCPDAVSRTSALVD